MFTLWLTLFLHYPLGFDPDSSEKPPLQPSTEEPSLDSEQPLSIETAPPTNSSPSLETQEEEEEEEQPPTTEELLAQIDKSVFDLPMVYNSEVQFWVEHFSSNGRWTLSKWIRASGKYKNLIRKELRNAGLPEDLLYLAMIESGFDPQAESSASAVGIWQFIHSTGETYGLMINDVIDERKDPRRSTQAAIAYLSKLHREFGNWHLAMAAYNAGEQRVYKAIGEHGTINYWELCQKEAFALETIDYVPRILAASILDRNPDLFGVPSTKKKAPPLITKMAYADRNQHLQTLADAAEISLEQFQEYNPHLQAERLLIKEPSAIIYLPPEKADVYQQNIRRVGVNRVSSGRAMTEEEIAEFRPTVSSPTPKHRKSFSYVVKEDDSWEGIAENFGLDVADLKHWNSDRPLSPGTKIHLRKPVPKRLQRYTVSSSDSLSKIARKFDCEVDDIRRWNGLSEEDKISKGDVIWIKVAADN